VAVAVAGAVGLVRLAYHVTTPKLESDGTIVRFKVVSPWIHPALVDLAQCPSESAACGSLEGFRRYAEERSLEKAWHVPTIKGIQTNGENVVFSTIRRPYEMIESYYPEFPTILALAAGKPSRYPLTDFSKAKVCIIPDRFLEADPRAVLDELRMLEQLPGRETTPYGLALDGEAVRAGQSTIDRRGRQQGARALWRRSPHSRSTAAGIPRRFW
jgi:hypothetical protein